MTFTLNAQQSVSFFSFFSFRVSSASFDHRAVKSSFRKICWVLCFFHVNRARYTLFRIHSVQNLMMMGRLPVCFPPKRWLLSKSCSESGGVTPILLLIIASTVANSISQVHRYVSLMTTVAFSNHD